jgi:hypothetical protein
MLGLRCFSNCRSHLNQIHTWHELNHLHFHLHHFNQFWFQAMLKFLYQNVFQIVNHLHHFNQFWFQVMLTFLDRHVFQYFKFIHSILMILSLMFSNSHLLGQNIVTW